MSKRQKEIIPSEGSRLFVDIGNSTLKAGLIDGQEWVYPHRSELDKAFDFLEWVNRHSEKIELLVVTSVREDVADALVSELENKKWRLLTVDDIPKDLIDYETPETLGLDRFFGCYAAVARTEKAAVVIDAGSAWTIDYMAKDFLFRGGVIMPGLTIMEEAIKKNLPALPMVEREIPEVWPGKSTKTSLQWGITGTYIHAIEKLLDKYHRTFGDFDLVATGGYAALIARHLNRDVKIRPSLVFDGMKGFLEDYL